MIWRRGGTLLFAVPILVLRAALFTGQTAAAENQAVWTPRAGEVSRKVLGLNHGSGEPVIDSTLHNMLEMPLNHLGFTVDYADPDQPLPDFRPYRAIVVWLSSYEMREAENFLPWLLAAMDAGVKLILPDGIIPPNRPDQPPVGEDRLGELLSRFGLEPAAYALPINLNQRRLVNLRPEYYSYETNRFQENSFTAALRIREGAEGVEVWQRIESLEDPEIHAVTAVHSDAGFWAQESNLLYWSMDMPGSGYRVSWNLNPWRMLRLVLGVEDMAIPDATTWSGTRGAYAHVDADGPSNLSERGVPGPSRYTLEVMFDEVWKKYDFPVTIGLIAAEFDPDLNLRFIQENDTIEDTLLKPRPAWQKSHREVATKLKEITDRIFKLPYVQAGCHSYTHPLDWKVLLPSYAIPDYQPTYEMETRGAVEYLNKYVLPPDKPVELYQWPGDCDPPPEPLAVLAQMGMENINGGDPMYDSQFDSIYYICPLSVPKGDYRQIYTSACNENIYTNGWIGFKGAFNKVIATFEKSESPLRLLPVNIYYHVFPAESPAGLRAIKNAYDWAKKQDLCWITALEYVRAARDFLAARVGRTGDGGWWAEEYNNCRTFRFDAEDRWIDMDASLNVAGFSRHNGSLYVSLLPGERAEMRFSDRGPDQPCLARASGLVRNVRRGDGFWQGECRSWSKGFMELWAPEGEWRASVSLPGGKAGQVPAERLPDGRLRLNLPGGAGQWLTVRLDA